MGTFGQRLRELRNLRGISQNELSKHIGVSKSSINMYERNEREPGFETLEAIADFFNVSIDDLLGKIPHNDLSTGDRLRAKRLEYGFTRKELSQRCGIAVSRIKKYEDGLIEPEPETLQRIADSIGVNVTDFIKFIPDGNSPYKKYVVYRLEAEINRAIMEGKRVVWRNGSLRTEEITPVDTNDMLSLSDEERSQRQLMSLSHALGQLNDEGKARLLNYADDLVQSGKYKKSGAAGLGGKEKIG